MKVYRVQYWEDGCQINEWFTTKAEAEKFIEKEKLEFLREVNDEPELRVIPTDKKGLVRWLNLWHAGDRP